MRVRCAYVVTNGLNNQIGENSIGVERLMIGRVATARRGWPEQSPAMTRSWQHRLCFCDADIAEERR
jgi:hypothetical protein